jgi:hypothetical protein
MKKTIVTKRAEVAGQDSIAITKDQAKSRLSQLVAKLF